MKVHDAATGAAAAVILGWGALNLEPWNATQGAIERRFAAANSQWMVIDGVRVHVRVDGKGPPIVLMHGSFGNTRTYDAWIGTLAQRHTVVRFDLPAHGLTGPSPDDDYSFARAHAFIDAMMDRLGHDRFALLGTSISGAVAFDYAAKRPERVSALILVNSAGLRRAAPSIRPRDNALRRAVAAHYRPQSWYARALTNVAVTPSAVPAYLPEEYHVINTRRGRLREQTLFAQQYVDPDVGKVLGAVRAPTLIIWSERSPVLSLELTDMAERALTQACRVDRITYAGTGHNIAIEVPERTAGDVAAFLDGPANLCTRPQAGSR